MELDEEQNSSATSLTRLVFGCRTSYPASSGEKMNTQTQRSRPSDHGHERLDEPRHLTGNLHHRQSDRNVSFAREQDTHTYLYHVGIPAAKDVSIS